MFFVGVLHIFKNVEEAERIQIDQLAISSFPLNSKGSGIVGVCLQKLLVIPSVR